MNKFFAFWCGLLGVSLFVFTTLLGGYLDPHYRHTSQFISELYAKGAPHADSLRYVGYIPSGVLLALFSIFALRTLPKSKQTNFGFITIGLFYGVGTVVCSLFTCDEGCNRELINPSSSQLIHNFTGLLTYVFVPIGLISIGSGAQCWEGGSFLSKAGLACGVVCILFFGLFIMNPTSLYVGIFQRMIEGSILLWIVLCSYFIKNR